MPGECTWCQGEFNRTNVKYTHIVSDYGFEYCNLICRKSHEPELIKKGIIKLPKDVDLSGKRVVDSDEWINGVWEDFGPTPVKITGGRKELIEVCKKTGLMPKALLTRKSREKGYYIKGDPTKGA